MTMGSTLETPVVVEDTGMSRGLSLKGSSSLRGETAASSGGGRTSDGVWVRTAVSCHRKNGRNHPSESRKIEGQESGVLTKRRGYRARTLQQSGDRRRDGDGIGLIGGVRGGWDDGRIGKLEGDPSIFI